MNLLLIIFSLIAMAFSAYLGAQKLTIRSARLGKYFTPLPENGTFTIVWKLDEIEVILYNPAPEWGVYIEGEKHIVLAPDTIEVLRKSRDPDLRGIGDVVYERFVTRKKFDFGIDHWSFLQRFFRAFVNVYFMGFEEYNVETFQIEVQKHSEPVADKDTGASQIVSTLSQMIPSVPSSQIPLVFDHQLISKGNQLKDLGYVVEEVKAKGKGRNRKPIAKKNDGMPGAFSIFYALNVTLFTMFPKIFVALAKDSKVGIADKVDSHINSVLLQYSQGMTYKDIVEERKEIKEKQVGNLKDTNSGFYQNLFSINGFSPNRKGLRMLLELDSLRINGETLSQSTGLGMYRYDLPDFNIEQKEMLKLMRVEQENITKNKAEKTNMEGKYGVLKAEEKVAKQEAVNAWERGQAEIGLDKAYAENLSELDPEVLTVMETRNFPETLLSLGKNGGNPGAVIAIPSDRKQPTTPSDSNDTKGDQRKFTQKNWRQKDWNKQKNQKK